MMDNKEYFQKAQKLFEWNELMYSGQSKAKLANQPEQVYFDIIFWAKQ